MLEPIIGETDVSLSRLQSELAERSVIMSYGAIWNLVHREGLSHKKPSSPPNETGLTLPAVGLAGSSISRGLILIVWSSLTRPERKPTWRRSQAGHRAGDCLLDEVPHGHWRTLTFLAAVRIDRFHAPCVLDEPPVNGKRFLTYVEQFLVPDALTRRRRHHGQSWIAQETLSRTPVPADCSYRPIYPTSIRSSRVLPNSNT